MVVESAKYLHPVSYRGAVFYFLTSSTTIGRKNQVKEFIDTDRQTVDDFGKKGRNYSIEGYVARLTDADSYKALRNRLIEAIESPGTGTLSHPIEGTLNNMAVVSASIRESVTDIGIGEVSITFTVSGTDKPLETTATISEANSANDNLLNVVGDEIAAKHDADTTMLGVYDSAIAKIQDVGDAFSSATSFIPSIADRVDDLTALIREFQVGFSELAIQPAELVRAFKDLFTTLPDTIETASGVFTVYSNLFKFGGDDRNPNLGTAAAIKEFRNRGVINAAVLASALSGAYVAAPQKPYRTVDEIDYDARQLESQFQTINNIQGIDPSILFALQNVKLVSNALLDELKLKTPTIIEVDSTLLSARTIAYGYYGSDEQAESIAQLNSTDGLSMSGKVSVFTK